MLGILVAGPGCYLPLSTTRQRQQDRVSAIADRLGLDRTDKKRLIRIFLATDDPLTFAVILDSLTLPMELKLELWRAKFHPLQVGQL